MDTFIYLHFNSDGTLNTIYMFDGEFIYYENIALKISISTLTDLCEVFDEPRTQEQHFQMLSGIDEPQLLSNDPEHADEMVLGGSFAPLHIFTELALQDLAAGILHRKQQNWLAMFGQQGIPNEQVGVFARLAGILNGARNGR